MVLLKDGFTVLPQRQKEDYCLAQHDVWSWRKSIFLLKKKERSSKTLTNPPTPLPENIAFLPYTPLPLEVDVICVSQLAEIVLYLQR